MMPHRTGEIRYGRRRRSEGYISCLRQIQNHMANTLVGSQDNRGDNSLSRLTGEGQAMVAPAHRHLVGW